MDGHTKLKDVDCAQCGQELDNQVVGSYLEPSGEVRTEWLGICRNPDCPRGKCEECGSVRDIQRAQMPGTTPDAKDEWLIVCSNPDCPTNDSDLAPAADGQL